MPGLEEEAQEVHQDPGPLADSHLVDPGLAQVVKVVQEDPVAEHPLHGRTKETAAGEDLAGPRSGEEPLLRSAGTAEEVVLTEASPAEEALEEAEVSEDQHPGSSPLMVAVMTEDMTVATEEGTTALTEEATLPEEEALEDPLSLSHLLNPRHPLKNLQLSSQATLGSPLAWEVMVCLV